MLLNILFAMFSVFSLKTDTSAAFSFSDEIDVFPRYKQLLVNIREQRISTLEAENEFRSILSILKENYPNTLDSSQIGNFVFPLTQSDYSAVGGNGSGFFIKNFNLFDHSVSGNHPAHDIFIYDPDQDCMDNRKRAFVDIVSVGNGVVLAVEKDWTDSSKYRGGNYVWVFDFERGGLWYYAHHRKIVVEPGQIVKPGDKLGEVGRTGFNAKNKRSDTHLHLMYLELDQDFCPKPKNYYEWLKVAETVIKPTQAEGIERHFFGKLSLIEPLPPRKMDVRNFDCKVKKRRV